MDAVAPEYVAARRVLLDALEALTYHLPSLILVGAQAVYHHTGDADLNVPLMTTDADLAIDTRGLADVPEIGSLLRGAGFVPGPNPGQLGRRQRCRGRSDGRSASVADGEGLGACRTTRAPRPADRPDRPWARAGPHRPRTRRHRGPGIN